MSSKPTIFMRYGRQSGGERVRVFDWLEHTGLLAVSHSFDPEPVRFGMAHIYRSPVESARRHFELKRRVRSLNSNDRALIYREASPLSMGRLEQSISEKTHTAFDLDDALFADFGGRFVRSKLFSRSEKAVTIAKSVQRVSAGNATIAEWASQYCKDVRVLPSCVAPRKYAQKLNYEISTRPRMVWIGSYSNERYLADIAPALRRLVSELGLQISVISSPSDKEITGLEGVVERITWDEHLAYGMLSNFDFGIMPLPDNLYERSKCGYKLLQYGAAALPSIGSPVGVNRDILASFGVAAPTSNDDYYHAITSLIDAPASDRKAMGERSRAAVESLYSYDVWAADWLAMINE